MKSLKLFYIILIGTLITLIGSVFPSLNLYFYDTPLKINGISIFGALIAAIGAFMQHRSSSKKSSNILENTIEQLKRTQEVAAQNLDIIQNISKTSLEFQNTITGGESYCELVISNVLGKMTFLASNHGDYTLYNLSARVFDQSLPIPNPGTLNTPDEADSIASWTGLNRTIKIGDLDANTTKPLMAIEFGLVEENLAYNIFFSARNGAFTQELRIAKVNGRWLSATRIQRQGSSDFIVDNLMLVFLRNIFIGIKYVFKTISFSQNRNYSIYT